MEWLVMMGGGLHATSSNLGWNDGERYQISDDCEENLLEMMNNLKTENRVTRPIRRSYAASRIVEMDLFPILRWSEGYPEVYHRVVQLLVDLSMPLEIMMPAHPKLSPEEGRSRDALRKMLLAIKRMFIKGDLINVVVRQMEYVLDECRCAGTPDETLYEPIEETFKLIRNILHISGDELNLKIVHELMTAGLGDFISEICQAEIQPSLVSNILAVMSLLFRGYHSKEIVTEAERQSNNSPDGDSHPPKTDEGAVNGDKKEGVRETQKDDPSEGSKEDSSKGKLRSQLASFALKFVQGSIDNIVKIVAKSDPSTHFKDIHFLWYLTYFLPLTRLPEVKYSHVRTFLSPAVISTMSGLTLETWEKYSKAQSQKEDSEANRSFKRLQLLVTCQHYFLSCLFHFINNNSALEESEAERVHNTMVSTVNMKSLRMMYILLLRRYQAGVETTAYLQELISGNHKLLLMAELIGNDLLTFDMNDHVSHFATPRMMLTYADLLSKFSTNTLKQNERAVLMMHHVAIDVKRVEVMYQVPILHTIAEVWQADTDKISEESNELFDYIIHSMCNECLLKPKKRILADAHITPRMKRERKKKLKRLKAKFATQNLDREAEGGLHVLPSDSEESLDGKVRSLEENVDSLWSLGYKWELRQLQDVLLEVCYLKLDCPKDKMADPHVWLYTSLGRSVPLVAYTESQQSLHEEDLFGAVVDQLGIQRDASQQWPTIPSFWTADMCLEAARHLGPLDAAAFKFEVNEEGKPVLDSQMTFLPDSGEDRPDSSSQLPSQKSVNALKYQLPSTSWLTMIQAHNMTNN